MKELMMRRSAWIGVLFVSGACSPSVSFCEAATAPSGTGTTSQLELNALLDRLGGLPVEYKADLGLLILSKEPKNLSVDRKKQLLDQIFLGAPTAKFATPFYYAARGADLANEQEENLFNEPVDTLDIQMRVVLAALGDMPSFAAAKFGDISLRASRANCANPLVEKWEPYFMGLLALLQNAKVVSISGGPKRQFVLNLLHGANSPELLVPLLRLLSSVDWNSSEAEEISIVLSRQLE